MLDSVNFLAASTWTTLLPYAARLVDSDAHKSASPDSTTRFLADALQIAQELSPTETARLGKPGDGQSSLLLRGGVGALPAPKDGKRTPLRPYMIFLAIVTLGVQLAPLLHSRIGSPKQGKVDQVFAFPLLLPLDSIVRAKGKLAPADATWAWALDVFAALSALEAVRSVFDSTTIFLTRAGATLLLQPRRVLGKAKMLDPITDNVELAWYQFFREQRAAAVVASICSDLAESQSDEDDEDDSEDHKDRDNSDNDASMPDDNDNNTSMPDKHPNRR